jgi:hypothetical protein
MDRKFRTIVGPSGVRIDSGWNCTPTLGRLRCRAAMTRSSSLHAVSSSSSGNPFRVTTSEWYLPASNGLGTSAKIPVPSWYTSDALPCTGVARSTRAPATTPIA